MLPSLRSRRSGRLHSHLCHLLQFLCVQEYASAQAATYSRPANFERDLDQHERTFYKFVTRPDIDAPVFEIDIHNDSALTPGCWFIAPYGQLGQSRPGQQWLGPHIYSGDGELIWSGAPMFGYWNTFDFESRIVQGERMLTVLSDHEQHGYVVNNAYEVVKKVPFMLEHDTKSNMHEFNVVDDGRHALYLTHTNEHMSEEVSRTVNFDGSCLARYQGFREVNLESGDGREVIFEWDANDHISLDETTFRKYDGSIEELCTKGWDVLHLNSIMKFPDGDYLLSARHTDAIYKISSADGSIVWRLGGVKSDFLQDNWEFSRQHHARLLLQNTTHTVLTLFDNAIGDGPFEKATSQRSRALTILLDTVKMRADIVAEYDKPRGGLTNARGSFQTLPNGNKFVCWAYNTYISEFGPDGSLVMEAKLSIPLHSYRAFKHPWIGRPRQPPDVVAEAARVSDHLITMIYVSWNGDTQTAKWVFSEVDSKGRSHVLGSTRRQGFESDFEYNKFAEQVFAEAFDQDGHSLGKSKVIVTKLPPPLEEIGHLSDDETDDAPLWHHSQTDGSEDAIDTSQASSAKDKIKTFAWGIAIGMTISALAWVCIVFFRRHCGGRVQKEQEARYMPLQEIAD